MFMRIYYLPGFLRWWEKRLFEGGIDYHIVDKWQYWLVGVVGFIGFLVWILYDEEQL